MGGNLFLSKVLFSHLNQKGFKIGECVSCKKKEISEGWVGTPIREKGEVPKHNTIDKKKIL